MNVRRYIEELYRNTPGLENYDTGRGSNIYDLVINALAYIFEDVLGDELDSIEEMRAWDSLYDLPYDVLVNVAKQQGIYVRQPADAVGVITMHFVSPIDWDIAAGTALASGTVNYYIADAVNIQSGVLATQKDGNGHYLQGGIRVINTDGRNVEANTLGYVDTAPAELIKITHPDIVGGVEADTSADIVSKIYNRALALSAANAQSITSIIHAYYPDLKVKVITPGDPLMERDKVYNLVPSMIEPKREVSFVGKTRRDYVINGSDSYFTTVPADQIDGSFTPDPMNEITQGQYLSITEPMDSDAMFSTQNILNETFTQSSERIGDTTPLLCPFLIYSRRLYVDRDELFVVGDSVHITHRGGDIPSMSGIVELVESTDRFDGVASSSTEIDLDGEVDTTDIVEGCKVYIVKADETLLTGYVASYDNVTKELVLADAVDIEAADVVVVYTRWLTLYNALPLAVDDVEDVYVDIVNAEGIYIGAGWIKSEHDMPIGTVIADNEIMVVNNELVMGTHMVGRELNLVRQLFIRIGMDRMNRGIIHNVNITGIVDNDLAPIPEPTPDNNELR